MDWFECATWLQKCGVRKNLKDGVQAPSQGFIIVQDSGPFYCQQAEQPIYRLEPLQTVVQV